jgi:5-methyltetrahydropteroyltriglutamate--homocysteine methyltransferase
MIEYFVRPLSGVRSELTFAEITAYRQRTEMRFRTRPPGVVEAAIGSGTLDLPDACARAKALARKPFKFTITGPHMLSKTLLDTHYGSTEEVCHAIADVLAEQVRHVDADIVQLDEANLPGHPEEWQWASAAINKVLGAVRGTPAVHLCFGNYGGQTVQSGTWDKLIGYLNSLKADHIVMENAHRPPDELTAFRDLRPEIGFGLGVVDVKATTVETADDIARSIERAETVLGPGRVRYIHPDCGLWMLKRSIADAKIAALAAGRDLYEGAGRAAA